VTGSLVSVIEALGLAGALLWIVKASVILGAGILAARAARRAKAAVRSVLLSATFAGLLALPLLMMFAPVLAVPMPERPVTRAAATPPVAPTGAVSGAAASRLLRSESAAGETTSFPWETAGAVLRATWAIVALTVLGGLALSVWRLTRLVRGGLPWLEVQPLVAELADEAGIRRIVHVVRHEQVAAPFTCGVRRPTIVLPLDAGEWSDADVRRALVHELEHVRRADWLLLLLARAACSVYWFHPLAWRALRTLCLEAERACDDAVLASGAGEDYADQLVTLAGRVRTAASLPALAMAGRSDLSVRVLALLDAGQRRGRAGRHAVATMVVVASAVIGLIGAVGAVSASTTVNHGASAPGDGTSAASTPDQQPRTSARAGQREVEREEEDEDEESSPNYMLYQASRRGNLRVMTALIDSGADVNAALGGDGSPLIGAARSGRLSAVQLLLDRGADVNLGVGGDGNPLIMAAREGHVDVIRLLLARGARVDEVVDGDENALIQASASGQLEAAKLLVANGADVNARVWADGDNGRGEWRTPLSQARRGRHASVVAFLESSGARE
jgi:beta-lactamase regulating signal transducer with metallopeptidase domain